PVIAPTGGSPTTGADAARTAERPKASRTRETRPFTLPSSASTEDGKYRMPLALPLQEPFIKGDLRGASDGEGDARVQLVGNHVEHVLPAGRSAPARLLRDQRQRMALVEHAKLSVRLSRAAIGWVEGNASLEQNAMDVPVARPGVTSRVRPPAFGILLL